MVFDAILHLIKEQYSTIRCQCSEEGLNVPISVAALMLQIMEAVIMLLMTTTMSHVLLLMLMMIMIISTMTMRRRRKTRNLNRIPYIFRKLHLAD